MSKNILTLAAILLICAIPASAIPLTPEETTLCQTWLAGHITDPQAVPPFSLTCAGEPFNAAAPIWTRTATQEDAGLNCTRHIITFTNASNGLAICLTALHYTDCATIEFRLDLTNTASTDSPLLERILPIDTALALGNETVPTLEYALGDSNSENSFAPQEQSLENGAAPFVLAPKAGRSSEDYMPFFNLRAGQAGIAIAIGWSGQWEASFAQKAPGAVQFACGMQTTHLKLHPGESIRTPSIALLFWKGPELLRGNNRFRQFMFKHILPQLDGKPVWSPICGSVGETDPDGSYEGPHIRVMKPLAQRGVEVFWSDMDPQQWYPIGFPDGTGTWEPDLAKYPHGLGPIGQAARDAGLDYLLWFEPERVAAQSRIARERPEWVTGGEKGGLFKLHIPEARAWITDYVDAQVAIAELKWMRWDFNIQPLSYWKQNDEPGRQGITEIRHIEGLYAMWDELMRRHPGMLIDLCASGGRRNDIESLRRGLPLWHSDLQCFGPHPAADQLQNGALYRWIPLHGCAAFKCEPDYIFRSEMTAGNIFAFNAAAPEMEEPVKRSVAVYQRVRPFLLGDFYPLFPHQAGEDRWYGYQFHREDLDAGCAWIFRREKAAESQSPIALQGLQPEAQYEVALEGSTAASVTMAGSDLQRYTVEITEVPGSVILYYTKVK